MGSHATASRHGGHKLHFEAVRVLQIRSLVPGPAGKGMLVRVHQQPAVIQRCCGDCFNVRRRAGLKRQMVQSRTAPGVGAGNIWSGFQDEILHRPLPTATVTPVLGRLVAELFKQPTQRCPGRNVVRDPNFNMVKLTC